MRKHKVSLIIQDILLVWRNGVASKLTLRHHYKTSFLFRERLLVFNTQQKIEQMNFFYKEPVIYLVAQWIIKQNASHNSELFIFGKLHESRWHDFTETRK